MNSCSPELVTLIFELACVDDLGETARRLGRVSKYFRAISEPIELRSIAICGIRQLRGAVARLNNAHISTASDVGRRDVTVRDLFISELAKEHAILADENFENSSCGRRSSFWNTDEGQKAEQFYFEHSDEFWRLATEFVKKTSPMLKTLVLLSSSNWFTWRGSYDLDRVDSRLLDLLTRDSRLWRRKYGCSLDRPKVLGVLSGAKLPNLMSLTINHNVSLELSCFGDDGSLFRTPVLPALRRLHIVSSLYSDKDIWNSHPVHVHPLLTCRITRSPNLQHLILCDNHMKSVEAAMKAIFGLDWQDVASEGVLPGKLRSVVLQQGMVPEFGCGLAFRTYKIKVWDFVRDVEHLNVPGLVAQYPTEMTPDAGKREYELLFSEWKEQCIGTHL